MKTESNEWPSQDVLRKLIEAAEILLHRMDYDGDEYEDICHCVDLAKKHLHPQPAEDPDEWVILDSVNYANHIPRVGIDEFSTGNGRWQVQKAGHCNGTVAYWKAAEDLIHRCRRRDLPKPKPQPQKTRIRLWSCDTDGVVVAEDNCPAPGWTEIHHDSEGFYVENQQ